MKLFLVRHPKPDTQQGLCYGDMDVPLAEGWEEGAKSLKNALTASSKMSSKDASHVCYHSPLSRAATLAEFISDGDSIAVDALKELDFGDWEGVLWKDIPREDIDLWADDIVNAAPYNGESLQVVADRVWTWWLSIQSALSNDINNRSVETCVLVAHSGVIKVLVSLLCQWPLAQAHRIDVGFTSLTEFSVKGDYVVLKRLGAGEWVSA